MNPNSNLSKRLGFLTAGLALFWTVLLVKTFYAQVIQSTHYSKVMKKQSEFRAMVKPDRGRIFDANGELLADNFRGKLRENPEITNGFRVYPFGGLASHVLGNVGWEGRGNMGIEFSLDHELYGIEGWTYQKVDARRRANLGYDLEGRKPADGLDVVLTIDMKIQEMVEEALSNQVDYVEAKAGTAIVVDPKTGYILAMANYPTYNPNAIGPNSALKNDAIQKVYEPGSTFKIITAAAALEEKNFSIDDSIDARGGKLKIYGDVIRDTHDYGMVNFAEAMAYSSNVAFAKIAESLGKESFFRYVRSFGFGMVAGITLPGEEKGVLKPVNKWSGRTLHTMAMGHEISVTPLQITMAVAALANDGKLMKPQIVKEMRNRWTGNVERVFDPRMVRKVVSPETAEQIKFILHDVVEYGTARNIKSDIVALSGKTGTAEKFDWETGKYSYKKNNASFVGMIPADNPKYVALVLIDEPMRYTSGAHAAGPVFKEIAENLMISPELENHQNIHYAHEYKILNPDLREKKPDQQVIKKLSKDLVVSFSGKGPWVIEQFPAPGIEMLKGDTLTLFLGDPAKTLPDFYGMPLGRVLEILENKGKKVRFEGVGRVVAQFPKKGVDWVEVDEVRLRLGVNL